MHNNSISEIAKQISHASDIAVYCHTNPDGDALGSMLALYVLLKNKGKTVVCYCDTPVPDKYKCMYASECVSFPEKRVHELAISVDCSDLDRLGQCMKSFLAAKSTIAIDHHASFRRFAALCYVDSSASACAEIVFELAKELKGIDDHVAELLFRASLRTVAALRCPTRPNARTRSLASFWNMTSTVRTLSTRFSGQLPSSVSNSKRLLCQRLGFSMTTELP